MAVQVSLDGFRRLWKYLLHLELANKNTYHIKKENALIKNKQI